ncbi:MAG: molybdopterin-guanine dinucleotide biosynthesis protein B [Candidatus Eisenbacteria bacterium]
MAHLWIQIVGSKKTGKTALLESVTAELVRRGRSVCYLKHRHEDARLDAHDTDTSRMIDAGAAAAALVGSSSTVVFRRSGDEPLACVALRESLPGDIVLVEGWKSVPGAKIVVSGGDLDVEALEGVIAVVGEPPAGFKGKTFDPSEVTQICDLIERTADAGDGDAWQTSLVIDGREIRLNAFVQDIFASGLLGMSRSLDGVDGADALEIRCRRKRRD